MDAQSIYISNGQIISDKEMQAGGAGNDFTPIRSASVVRVQTGPEGTEVRWTMFSANWSSLYFVMEWLPTQPAPYKLRYFLSGWFEESHDNADDAVGRIHELMGKSDVHLSTLTFVKEADPGKVKIPDLLSDVLNRESAEPDYTVDLVQDNETGKFIVERIGPRSCIANLFGLSPASYPARIGHTYDQIVSQAYLRVLKDGAPHYDQILAAMQRPDSDAVWYPYQRVILPHRFPDGTRGVSVVAELADVDIKVV